MGNGDMINLRNAKPGLTSLGFVVLVAAAILFQSCSKKEDWKEIQPTKDATSQQSLQQEKAKELAKSLLAIEDKIRQAPTDQSLRQELLKLSVSEKDKLIRAAGVGKAPENASSPAIARQAAERTAYIDANRWLLYILKWRQDASKPDFGAIKGQLPGARIVVKDYSAAGEAIVLVETTF